MHQYKINGKIIATKIVLIDSDGSNKGEISKFVALELAKKQGLDLVQVSQNGPVPVCRIADYGKMMYHKSKSEKHSHTTSLKELRIKPSTGPNDLERQIKKAKQFLLDGNKVLFVMIAKGREKSAYAKEIFQKAVLSCKEDAKISDIKEGGDNYNILLTPH